MQFFFFFFFFQLFDIHKISFSLFILSFAIRCKSKEIIYLFRKRIYHCICTPSRSFFVTFLLVPHANVGTDIEQLTLNAGKRSLSSISVYTTIDCSVTNPDKTVITLTLLEYKTFCTFSNEAIGSWACRYAEVMVWI